MYVLSGFLLTMIKKSLGAIGEIVIHFFKKEEAWLVLFLLGISGLFFITIPKVSLWEIINFILLFLSYTWWLWFFLIVFPLFHSLFLFWRNEEFKKDLKFILLEILIPREVQKSPQAMEQVLAALHSLRNAPGDIKETYYEGEVTVPFGLEMISFGGEIHFYVRCQKKQRNLVEAAFFSYYQDVEFIEVEDYAKQFPQTLEDLYAQGKDMWGTEMVLAKPAVYPIKSYTTFESEAESKQFDPISTFLEVLGKINKEEIVGIQFIIAPAGNEWKDKFKSVLDELQEPATAEIASDEGGSRKIPISRTPGQYDVLEAVEKNLSKPAFNTMLRFIYLSPKATYYDSFARRGLVGAFNQYAALNLNSFSSNRDVATRTQIWNWPHIFPKIRNQFRKQRLLRNFLIREIPPETWMGRFVTSYIFNFNFSTKRFLMNIECLATLFHLPTVVVLTAPHIKRSESKKAGPPAGIAIFGEDKELDQFYHDK